MLLLYKILPIAIWQTLLICGDVLFDVFMGCDTTALDGYATTMFRDLKLYLLCTYTDSFQSCIYNVLSHSVTTKHSERANLWASMSSAPDPLNFGCVNQK